MDKPNEQEEPVEEKVGETTKMVEEERSTIIIHHQEDQSLEDLFKQWGDMCSNYLKNQMTEHNTARQ